MNDNPLSDEYEEGELPDFYEREDGDPTELMLDEWEEDFVIEVDLEDDIGECEGEC